MRPMYATARTAVAPTQSDTRENERWRRTLCNIRKDKDRRTDFCVDGGGAPEHAQFGAPRAAVRKHFCTRRHNRLLRREHALSCLCRGTQVILHDAVLNTMERSEER